MKTLQMWTQEEREEASKQVCSGGKVAGISFFTRHPDLGFAVAVSLQCEVTALKDALRYMYDSAKELSCDCFEKKAIEQAREILEKIS